MSFVSENYNKTNGECFIGLNKEEIVCVVATLALAALGIGAIVTGSILGPQSRLITDATGRVMKVTIPGKISEVASRLSVVLGYGTTVLSLVVGMIALEIMQNKRIHKTKERKAKSIEMKGVLSFRIQQKRRNCRPKCKANPFFHGPVK